MTPKKILGPSPPSDRSKSGSRFVFDPATGALVVDSNLDLKIRKALSRATGQIEIRQQLCLHMLYFRYLEPEVRRTMLLIRCHTSRRVGNFSFNRKWHETLLRWKDISIVRGLCQLADNRHKISCHRIVDNCL